MGEAFKGKAYVYVELKVLNEIDYHSIDTKDSNTITAVIPLSEDNDSKPSIAISVIASPSFIDISPSPFVS